MRWSEATYDAATQSTGFQRNVVQGLAKLRDVFACTRPLSFVRFGLTSGTS